ncbi:MAG: stress response translation initiation inhibitor YciH [Caldilineaceae bacterium]|nr:stress response translation initiation inhibitor YciH [Caldilineaceae bacterium]
MAEKSRRLVYSTDPEPETQAASAEATPRNPAAPYPTRQQGKPVRVQLERKGRGGKSVSVITGVLSPAHGRQALLKLLKNKLGTGGALKDDNVEIQGDHRDKIVELLKELGYQAKKAGG